MAAIPSTSAGITQAISPPRKRGSLGHLTVAEKQCVVNTFKRRKLDDPDLGNTAIVALVADTLGK